MRSDGYGQTASHRPPKAFVNFRKISSFIRWELLKNFELMSFVVTIILTTSVAILLRIIDEGTSLIEERLVFKSYYNNPREK